MGNPPAVNISELDREFHNYQSLASEELKKISGRIIEAIKNKRAEKQLIDLMERANNCSDNDLWNFIQELEKFSSLSLYTKNAYLTHQNEADTTLAKLRQRWDNLDEEKKLANYWNNAIRNFDHWLKEADNLPLTTEEPFGNFKEEIKKCQTKEAIDEKEKQAYQYILTKFKAVVKQSLGTEQKAGEYQEIDSSKTVEEVKLAREKIKQERQGNDNQTPPNPRNSNEFSSKIAIGVAAAIGVGLVILVLIGRARKGKRRKKSRPR